MAYTGGETGFRTVINTGPGGGQEVYHMHAHMLAGAASVASYGLKRRDRMHAILRAFVQLKYSTDVGPINGLTQRSIV